MGSFPSKWKRNHNKDTKVSKTTKTENQTQNNDKNENHHDDDPLNAIPILPSTEVTSTTAKAGNDNPHHHYNGHNHVNFNVTSDTNNTDNSDNAAAAVTISDGVTTNDEKDNQVTIDENSKAKTNDKPLAEIDNNIIHNNNNNIVESKSRENIINNNSNNLALNDFDANDLKDVVGEKQNKLTFRITIADTQDENQKDAVQVLEMSAKINLEQLETKLKEILSYDVILLSEKSKLNEKDLSSIISSYQNSTDACIELQAKKIEDSSISASEPTISDL